MSAQIFVIGHRKPDTDSSTSAVAYARFLNASKRYPERAVAVIPGEMTPQAKWVFQFAGVDIPAKVETLAPRVSDVAQMKPLVLKGDQRLRDAVDTLIRSGHSMLPIVDNQNKLCGVFSNREDVCRLLLNLDVAPIAGSLLVWQDLVQLPGCQKFGRTSVKDDCGRIVVAIAGDMQWMNTVSADDVLIAGSLDILDQIPSDRQPTRIILIGEQDTEKLERELDSRCVVAIVSKGTLTDLLFALTKQVKLSSLCFDQGICVGENDFLEDVCDLVSSSRRALPVVNDNNQVVGVIARKDMKAPSRRKAILIDHFESDQAIPGIETLEIVEIVDHHRIGNIETPAPVRVDCRPIGSSCSIVALNYFEAQIEPDRATAILLLGGLCADTLSLRGPTATPLDRKIAERLAEIAGVDLENFGSTVLLAGDDLMTANAADIWNRDQKIFGVRNKKFAVAQLETVAMHELTESQLRAFRDELQKDFERNNYLSSLLVVTDVVCGNSWITGIESNQARGTTVSTFGSNCPCEDWVKAANVVSRKQQIVPELMKTFAELSL